MVKVYHLRLNQDGTITVRVGRQRESFGLIGKTKAELFDEVKWSLVMMDVFISDVRLAEDLNSLIWDRLR